MLSAFHFSLRFLDPKKGRSHLTMIQRKASNSQKSAESRVKEARMFAFSVPGEGHIMRTLQSIALEWRHPFGEIDISRKARSCFSNHQGIMPDAYREICGR
jgi:hypothetical protein